MWRPERRWENPAHLRGVRTPGRWSREDTIAAAPSGASGCLLVPETSTGTSQAPPHYRNNPVGNTTAQAFHTSSLATFSLCVPQFPSLFKGNSAGVLL